MVLFDFRAMNSVSVGPRSLSLVSTCCSFDKSQYSFFKKKKKKSLRGLVLFWESLVGAPVTASFEPSPPNVTEMALSCEAETMCTGLCRPYVDAGSWPW